VFARDDGTLAPSASMCTVSFVRPCANSAITKGVRFDPRRDAGLYERYYGDYLPRVVAPFRPVIVARGVVSYFFGGSTPSLMRTDTMRAVFRLFPDMARALENHRNSSGRLG